MPATSRRFGLVLVMELPTPLVVVQMVMVLMMVRRRFMARAGLCLLRGVRHGCCYLAELGSGAELAVLRRRRDVNGSNVTMMSRRLGCRRLLLLLLLSALHLVATLAVHQSILLLHRWL
ncbi:hypothetical protein TKK_0018151 [Trichogramma kaykai]